MSADSREMELRLLLAHIVEVEPVDRGFCAFCFAYQDHADDCPWAVARAYLTGGTR